MSRCTCGAKDVCPTRAIRQQPHHLPMPGRPDPAAHWATEGDYDLFAWLYGPDVALRLQLYANLWVRDGAGSRWHRDYWAIWDRLGITASQEAA